MMLYTFELIHGKVIVGTHDGHDGHCTFTESSILTVIISMHPACFGSGIACNKTVLISKTGIS